MKKKKGFTLIELLAIIVILAIIAVITVPIILNIIEESKKGAAKDSAYGYKDSVNKYYTQELLNNQNLKLNDTYTVTNGTLSGGSFGDPEVTSFPIQVSGTIPTSGSLTYENNVLKSGCLVIGDYAITFGTDGSVSSTVKGDCSSSNEQGGNTPVAPANPYFTTFDGNYAYMGHDCEGEFCEFNNEWIVYLRKNTSTNIVEACRVFPSGTVCLAPEAEGYFSNMTGCGSEEVSSDISCLSGYIEAKADEMISKGASSCSITWGNTLYCYLSSGGYCLIDNNGDVACYDDNGNNCNNDHYGDYGCY